jgi:WD repeat-containing protein 76
LLAQLDIKEAVKGLGVPPPPKPKAKPIQPAKKVKREKSESESSSAPRRQSARLRQSLVDLHESPAQKRKREVSGAEPFFYVDE